MNCCEHIHPYDRFDVERSWQPPDLRCLIVGENPGSPESVYFYDPENGPVVVRDALLQNLSKQELIASATLKGFKEAGFLFDHAIRCPLPKEIVKKEQDAAKRYKAKRVQNSEHLREHLAYAPIVWVMGHLACNAVANIIDEFPKKRRGISSHPYPGEDKPNSRFFVSEYLTWRNEKNWAKICSAFVQFARLRWD